MNYVIVQNVRMSRKLFKANNIPVSVAKDQQMDTRQRTMKGAEIQLTIMLLLVTTLFLILLCPTHVRYIYLSFAKRDTPLNYANSLLIFQLTSKLYATNSGINFFLYCISGQKFRNDLKGILCCVCNSHPPVNVGRDEPHSTAVENCSGKTKGSSYLSSH